MFTLPAHRWITCGALVVSLALSAVAFAAEPGDPPVRAGEDWLFVPGHQGADDVWISGFYREPSRAGEIWVDPHLGEHEIHVPGHWVPEAPEGDEAYTWVRGYRDDEGAWVPGFWRAEQIEGFQWVPGYYDAEGRWVSGHWRPAEARADSVWVPGHVVQDHRIWRIGFWRPNSKDGFVWVDGYYADDVWYAGYWAPVETRVGFIWVPGYAQSYLWHMGYWRPMTMHGRTWVPGHWHHGAWVPGFWAMGTWHRPFGVTFCHYAHYHHHHGHNHDHDHDHVRKTRYAAYRGSTSSSEPRSDATPREDAKTETETAKRHLWSETAQPRPSPPGRRPAAGREHDNRTPLPATNPRYDNPPIRPASERKTDTDTHRGAASRGNRGTERDARRPQRTPRHPAAAPARRKVPAARPRTPQRRKTPTARPDPRTPHAKPQPTKARPAAKVRPGRRPAFQPKTVVRPQVVPPPRERLPAAKKQRIKTKPRSRSNRRSKRPSRDEQR